MPEPSGGGGYKKCYTCSFICCEEISYWIGWIGLGTGAVNDKPEGLTLI